MVVDTKDNIETGTDSDKDDLHADVENGQVPHLPRAWHGDHDRTIFQEISYLHTIYIHIYNYTK